MTATLTPTPATRSAYHATRERPTTRDESRTGGRNGAGRSPLGRFRDLATARKLLAGYLVIVVLMVAVGVLGIARLGAAQDEFGYMYRDNFEATLWLADVAHEMSASTDAVHDATISGRSASIPELKVTFAEADRALDEHWAAYTATDMTGREQARDAFAAALADYRRVRDEQLVPAIAAGDIAGAVDVLQNVLVTPEEQGARPSTS